MIKLSVKSHLNPCCSKDLTGFRFDVLSRLHWAMRSALSSSPLGGANASPQCVILVRHRRSSQEPTAQLYLKQLSTATAAGSSRAARGKIFPCGNGDSWFQRPGVERWLPPRLTNWTPGNSRAVCWPEGDIHSGGEEGQGRWRPQVNFNLLRGKTRKGQTDRHWDGQITQKTIE